MAENDFWVGTVIVLAGLAGLGLGYLIFSLFQDVRPNPVLEESKEELTNEETITWTDSKGRRHTIEINRVVR